MRVLLLEDDEDVGPWVRTGLKENGHVVDLFANGKRRSDCGDAAIIRSVHI
jgi:DNA-binding response OmpR family regulator